jgi:trigger factor
MLAIGHRICYSTCMKITRNTNKTVTTLTIDADTDELNQAKSIVLKSVGSTMKLAGFRAGKIPADVVEKNIDPNTLQAEVLNEALNRLYSVALQKEDVRAVAEPKLTVSKFVPYTELQFVVEVQTLGEVKLYDYKQLKLKKEVKTITDKEISDVIESLTKRAATKTAVKRAAKSGDEVVIDFMGVDSKNQPIAGADGENYPLLLGSNSFIPGFEDNVVGMNQGEEKSFMVTFPKDYGVSSLQNKKVTFTVTLHTVNELILPIVDDSFAAEVGPFKNLEELKADISKQMSFEREREATSKLENDILTNIVEKSVIEIPEVLIAEQVERMVEEEKQKLLYQGQTWEEHLKAEGSTEETHKAGFKDEAVKRIKVGVALSYMSEQEGIEVTPEEVATRQQLMKSQYTDPGIQAELDKPEILRDLRARIATEKTLARLVEYVSVK